MEETLRKSRRALWDKLPAIYSIPGADRDME